MPGCFTSMPKTVLPLALSAPSSRASGLPMTVNLSALLSGTSLGTGCFAAEAASDP